MKKERRIYTKATDKLKKLFGNESAVYFSNVGQDDETGVINSHGLSLEDADEVGQFEFLYLVGRHEALIEFRELDVKQPQTQPHYDNTNGSLYKIATDLGLNHWEFDLFKRLVRCRKKGEFEKDLQKIKDTCDIYLREYK